MRDWFTAERVDGETWKISERGHWEQPNSWLLIGQGRAALIDSGLGVGDIAAMARREKA